MTGNIGYVINLTVMGEEMLKKDKTRLYQMLNSENVVGWLFLGPVLIIVIGLIFIPLCQAFLMGFQDLNLKRPANSGDFAGLKNYISVFTNAAFYKSMLRTLVFMVISVLLEFSIGIALGLVLNIDFIGRRLLQTMIIIPWAIPITVNGLMWKWILNSSYGALNALLLQFGLIDQYQSWLGDPQMAFIAITLASVWKETPVVAFLTLASLKTIPDELYEVSYLDGASRWRELWSITLPSVLPMLMVTLILKTVDAFKVFDIIYVMTMGGPYDSTKTIAYLTYEETFSYLNFGRGAAMAIVMTLIIGCFALFYYRILDRKSVTLE